MRSMPGRSGHPGAGLVGRIREAGRFSCSGMGHSQDLRQTPIAVEDEEADGVNVAS